VYSDYKLFQTWPKILKISTILQTRSRFSRNEKKNKKTIVCGFCKQYTIPDQSVKTVLYLGQKWSSNYAQVVRDPCTAERANCSMCDRTLIVYFGPHSQTVLNFLIKFGSNLIMIMSCESRGKHIFSLIGHDRYTFLNHLSTLAKNLVTSETFFTGITSGL